MGMVGIKGSFKLKPTILLCKKRRGYTYKFSGAKNKALVLSIASPNLGFMHYNILDYHREKLFSFLKSIKASKTMYTFKKKTLKPFHQIVRNCSAVTAPNTYFVPFIWKGITKGQREFIFPRAIEYLTEKSESLGQKTYFLKLPTTLCFNAKLWPSYCFTYGWTKLLCNNNLVLYPIHLLSYPEVIATRRKNSWLQAEELQHVKGYGPFNQAIWDLVRHKKIFF